VIEMALDNKYLKLIEFIKTLYPNMDTIPLHAPVFKGNEKEYLDDCIKTSFVSYVGKYVSKFEEMTTKYTGSKYAIAVVNGTVALQVAMQLAGVKPQDEVITQPLTFVATANAIAHVGATPVFVDVDSDTLGMSPDKLDDFLNQNTKWEKKTEKLINLSSSRPISAIVPMHTFGHPCRIDEITEIAEKYGIPVIEDSAESLGSFYKGKHTGTFGQAGVISYNGNKTITTGGGGMILTDDEDLARKIKHITTTAKIPHQWEYVHDEIAYNYRLTNVNAAIGVAQMEKIDAMLANKASIAEKYALFCNENDIKFFDQPVNARSNYWLNAILLSDKRERDDFLRYTNENGIITRPIWKLMNKLEMYKKCLHGDLSNAESLENKIVNIPSGANL